MEKVSLKVFKSILPYIARYRKQYCFGMLCLVFVDGAQMLIPQLMRRAVDLISLGNFEWKKVFFLALGMVGAMGGICVGRFWWRFFIHGASRRIETEIRGKIFEHLLTLSYDFYQKNKIGDLMARSTNDLGAVRMAVGWGLVGVFDGIAMSLAIVVIIFIQDARTAFFAVLPLPIITVLILLFGKVVGKQFFRVQETYSKMSDTVQETFAGIRVIKSFVKESWFTGKFAEANDEYRKANMDLIRYFGVFFPLIAFLSGLTTLILLFVGGQRVVLGLMTPGDFVALESYLQMLIWPLMGAGFMVNMIQRGAVALTRINEVLDTKPSIASPEKPLAPAARTGGSARGDTARSALIEVRGLSFSYPGGGNVLEGIDLVIEEGDTIGILGRTGSGKSTLIKTFVRMVDPPPGTVLVKGIPVADWDLRALRSLFGVTPQDSYLFSDSLKNNIIYGLEPRSGKGEETAAGEELIAGAVELSALDQDLKSFHQGRETLIGERGLTLSGGQKQRAAIARAVIGMPEILILDDSLSAVDAETEKRILTALFRERKGKATIIISHRVSTLQNADKVIVLDRGRVSEAGKPGELIERGGFYAQTAELQQLDSSYPARFSGRRSQNGAEHTRGYDA
ncbi:MAG: ABC transporter ATP-binding protein/permease [Spirochaetaceae bacterium]|jgi:ATP-binding cassette subfamily B protein|nr:ABC transporter ATP-binding protein/permease [Spirochaetaceae bacterium]